MPYLFFIFSVNYVAHLAEWCVVGCVFYQDCSKCLYFLLLCLSAQMSVCLLRVIILIIAFDKGGHVV